MSNLTGNGFGRRGRNTSNPILNDIRTQRRAETAVGGAILAGSCFSLLLTLAFWGLVIAALVKLVFLGGF